MPTLADALGNLFFAGCCALGGLIAGYVVCRKSKK
jgi:hypothetical protein